MNITAYTKYGHRILRIEERVGLTSDISDLRQAVNKVFEDGLIHIAIQFTGDSFLSSRMLALLIESAEKFSVHCGSFTVISPNAQIREVLSIFDLEWTLRTVKDEKNLLAPPVKALT